MLSFFFYSNTKPQPSLLSSPASHQHPILCCLKAQALSWQGQGSAQKTQEGLQGEKVVKKKWFSIIWGGKEKGSWECLPVCNLCPGLKQAQFWRHKPVYRYWGGGQDRAGKPCRIQSSNKWLWTSQSSWVITIWLKVARLCLKRSGLCVQTELGSGKSSNWLILLLNKDSILIRLKFYLQGVGSASTQVRNRFRIPWSWHYRYLWATWCGCWYAKGFKLQSSAEQ